MALRKDSAQARCSVCILALYTGTFSCQLEYLSLPSRLRAFGHSKNVLESIPGMCPVPELPNEKAQACGDLYKSIQSGCRGQEGTWAVSRAWSQPELDCTAGHFPTCWI